MNSDLNLADEVDFIKNDINFAVDYIDVSQKLPEKDGKIYINIQTKEKDRFCVELSSSGFKVCPITCLLFVNNVSWTITF